MNFLKFLIIFILTTNFAFAKKIKNSCDEYPPQTITAVLIDVSEPLDVPNNLAYQKISDRLIQETKRSTRFDIYKIGGSSSGVSGPIISLCIPTAPSENKLLKGEKFWANKIEKEFIDPLKSTFIKLGNDVMGGKESPILESIFTMSIKSFISPNTSQNMPGRVVVISDFMQHSAILSFYNQSIPQYSDWRATPSGRSWVRNFGKVDFEAIVIPRVGSSILPKQGRDFFVTYTTENFSSLTWRDIATSISPSGK